MSSVSQLTTAVVPLEKCVDERVCSGLVQFFIRSLFSKYTLKHKLLLQGLALAEVPAALLHPLEEEPIFVLLRVKHQHVLIQHIHNTSVGM